MPSSAEAEDRSRAEKRPRVLLVTRSIVLNEKGEILLLKRSEEAERWAAGFWEFPGGKIEEGKDLSHAMEDEVLEEAGLVVAPVSRLSYVESEIVSKGPYRGLPYIIIVGVSKLVAGEVRLSDEHTDFAWVSKEEAHNYSLKHDIRRALIELSPQLNSILSEEGLRRD